MPRRPVRSHLLLTVLALLCGLLAFAGATTPASATTPTTLTRSSSSATGTAPRTVRTPAVTPVSRSAMAAGTLHVSPGDPIAGERVRFITRVPGKGRVVVLQVRKHRKWVALTRARSKARGAVTLIAALPRARRVRVYAPPARAHGKRYKAFTGRAKLVRTVTQSATLVMDDSVFVSEKATGTATFSPARLGRPVALQRWTGSGWATVTTVMENTQGQAVYALGGSTPGSFTYRAVALTANRAPQVTTGTRGVQVLPSQITVTPDYRPLTDAEAADLTAADPDGNTLTFAPGADQPDLTVGQILSLLPSASLPNGALVRITAVTTAPDGTLTASTTPVAIDEIVENIPPDFDGFAATTLSTEVQSPIDGVTLESSTPTASGGSLTAAAREAAASASSTPGLAAMSMPQLRFAYSFDVTETDAGNGTTTPNGTLDGHLYFTPGIDFSVHTKWWHIKDWRIGLRSSYDFEANLTVGATIPFDFEKEWNPIRSVSDIQIGPIPVVVVNEVRPVVSLSGDGTLGVKTGFTVSGAHTIGMKYQNGGFSFYHDGDDDPDVTAPQPTGAGTMTLFGGLQADLEMYNLAGPFARFGAELGGEIQASQDTGTGAFNYDSCDLYVRPALSFGVTEAGFLKRLFHADKGEISTSVDFAKLIFFGCFVSPPEIATTTLPDATAGDSYTTRLQTTDNRDGTWTWGGFNTPPVWLHLSADGTLSGTPAASDPDQSTIDVTFTDLNGKSASQVFTLTVIGGTPPTDPGSGGGGGGGGGATDPTPPTVTAPTSGWVEISASGGDTCGIRADHSLWCWGDNNYGQIGNGTVNSNPVTTPVRVGDATDWVHVSAGNAICAIKTDGTLWCWGQNSYGALGTGSYDQFTATPTQVGTDTNWDQVSAGQGTCAHRTDNTIWCWGRNSEGQLGTGTHDTSAHMTPVQVGTATDWANVTDNASSYNVCGVKTDATAWCWGGNYNGSLGDGTQTEQDAPVRVVGDGWSTVGSGEFHSCGLSTSGAVSCWGNGINGQLGTGTYTSYTTPVPVSASGTFASLTTDTSFNCGLAAQDRSILCWGENQHGELGNGTTNEALSPVPITAPAGTTWWLLDSGSAGACAITTDGAAWCWGAGGSGQLGNGTASSSLVPVRVTDPTP